MTVRSLTWVVLACSLLPGSVIAADDALELVLLGDQRLTRLVVNVEVDGQPLPTVWDKGFRRLFDHLDRDGNGRLDKAEAARLPSATRVRQLSWGYFFTRQDRPLPWDVLIGETKAEALTFDNVAAYYRRQGLGHPVLAAGVEPAASPLTSALLRRLDRNSDGRVDRAEWQSAEQSLAALDLNEDEVISPDELAADRPYPSIQGNTVLEPPTLEERPSTIRDPLGIVPLSTSDADLGWAEWVVRHPAASRPKLDTRELAAWRQKSPDHELTLRLGRRRDGEPRLEWRSGRDVSRANEGELLQVKWDDVRLTVGSGDSRLLGDFSTFRDTAQRRFAEADANGDGLVDETELPRTTFAPLRALFSVADRDSDGKLTSAEWTGWLDVEASLLAGQVVLSMVDQGRGLFELLDADRDGRLSRRELRGAWSRLEAAGCLDKESFQPERLPRQMLGAIGVGPQRLPVPLVRRAGPTWFRAMDRDGDGDLSPKELLGPVEVFRRLDADGDGLISPAEAERP